MLAAIIDATGNVYHRGAGAIAIGSGCPGGAELPELGRAGAVSRASLRNLVIQAMAMGVVQDVAEGREVVRRRFPQTEYQD